MGPGGASTSPINLGGGLDAPRTTQTTKAGVGTPTPASLVPSKATDSKQADEAKIAAEAQALEKAQTELEKKRMESLMEQLKEAISKSQALEPFKDQLLLDITPEGLRIQIVDAQNRPMFDIGSSKLKGYTAAILHEITPYLISVPNHISVTGHTDTTPYLGITGYTNWDLSTDRANAARRALEGSGLSTERVSRVVGLSSSVLFDRGNPRNPINRRISIVVLTKEAEQEALKTDVPLQVAKSDAGAPAAGDQTAGGGTEPALVVPIGPTGPTGEPAKNGLLPAPIEKPVNPPMGAVSTTPVPAATQASTRASATAVTQASTPVLAPAPAPTPPPMPTRTPALTQASTPSPAPVAPAGPRHPIPSK
jgi:chemotaxis protein MotB